MLEAVKSSCRSYHSWNMCKTTAETILQRCAGRIQNRNSCAPARDDSQSNIANTGTTLVCIVRSSLKSFCCFLFIRRCESSELRTVPCCGRSVRTHPRSLPCTYRTIGASGMALNTPLVPGGIPMGIVGERFCVEVGDVPFRRCSQHQMRRSWMNIPRQIRRHKQSVRSLILASDVSPVQYCSVEECIWKWKRRVSK